MVFYGWMNLVKEMLKWDGSQLVFFYLFFPSFLREGMRGSRGEDLQRHNDVGGELEIWKVPECQCL